MRYSRKAKLATTLRELLPAWEKQEVNGDIRLVRGRISVEPDHYLGARLRVYLDGKRISTVRIPESSIRKMADSMKDTAILAYYLAGAIENTRKEDRK